MSTYVEITDKTYYVVEPNFGNINHRQLIGETYGRSFDDETVIEDVRIQQETAKPFDKNKLYVLTDTIQLGDIVVGVLPGSLAEHKDCEYSDVVYSRAALNLLYFDDRIGHERYQLTVVEPLDTNISLADIFVSRLSRTGGTDMHLVRAYFEPISGHEHQVWRDPDGPEVLGYVFTWDGEGESDWDEELIYDRNEI